MNKKTFLLLSLLLIITLNTLTAAGRQNELKLGIGSIISPFKELDSTNREFFIELEEGLISGFTALPFADKSFLTINSPPGQLKRLLKGWNRPETVESQRDKEIISSLAATLEEVDLAIYLELPIFLLTKEADFYEPTVVRERIVFELKVMLVDCSKMVVLEESRIKIDMLDNSDVESLKVRAIDLAVKRFTNFLNNSAFLKATYNILAKNGLFVWIDGGYLDGIKREQLYIARDSVDSERRRGILVKVVKADYDRSLALICYEDYALPADSEGFKAGESKLLLDFTAGDDRYSLTKLNKAGLELQLAGGVLLADLQNGLSGGEIKALPMVAIRGLIPVRALFFRPVIEVDFTFLFESNSLLAPFIFKAGVIGEFNIYRFGLGGGFLIGAYFSQDSSNNYRIDTFVLQPYLQLSGQLNSSVRFFGEFGYKYAHESKFKRDWKIDISGIYITAGLGLLL